MTNAKDNIVADDALPEPTRNDGDDDRLSDITVVTSDGFGLATNECDAVRLTPSQSTPVAQGNKSARRSWIRFFRRDEAGSPSQSQSKAPDSLRNQGSNPSQMGNTGNSTCLILGSLVTFGPGLNIEQVIPGNELCTVTLRNLLPRTSDQDVKDILMGGGVNANSFYLLGIDKCPVGRCSAKAVAHVSHAFPIISRSPQSASASGISGPASELGPYEPSGSMVYSTIDTEKLILSWKCSSLRYVLQFSDSRAARLCLQKFRETPSGRQYQVQLMPVASKNSEPNALELSGLKFSLNEEVIRSFVDIAVPECTFSLQPYDAFVMSSFHQFLTTSSRCLVGDPALSKAPSGATSVCAVFDSWFEAHRMFHLALDTNFVAQLSVAKKTFKISVPPPVNFRLTISMPQYLAQQTQWTSLVASLDPRIVLRFHKTPDNVTLVLTANGWDNTAILGAVKVQVEELAAGETIDGWHPSFLDPRNQFLPSLTGRTGGHIIVDRESFAIRAMGSHAAIGHIKDLVSNELQRLGVDSSLQLSADVPLHCRCPVCYGHVCNPFALPCGHLYCWPCLRSWLRDLTTPDDFPIVCRGDKASCGVPLTIAAIQAILPPAEYNELLRLACSAYLDAHEKVLRRCPTLHCPQIHRVHQHVTVSTRFEWPTCNRCTAPRLPTNCCPSCFVEIG